MRPKVSQSQVDFKKKGHVAQTPIRQMNKSQVSVKSQASDSRSQKSLSQGHSSRVALRSGNMTLAQRMEEEPSDIDKLKQQIAELKIMQLSEDARQNLMKFQRFDRILYPIESDKVLKKPIQQELRRLQKIKNEQGEMRVKHYDNQLTITALHNHIKILYQMNRQLQQREVLRKEKDDAVRKMFEQKQESMKQIKQLKEEIRLGYKQMTPIKVQRQQSRQQSGQKLQTPQPNLLKKQQITALNFISATIRGRKYAEALEQMRKFLQKSRQSLPEACRLIDMFVPALEDQIATLVQAKTVETKLAQINSLIDKANKEIRTNHFQQLQKIKNQTLKATSAHKNIGLLIQSVLNMKKNDEAEKKKRGPPEDYRSLQKVNQKMKTTEDQLKAVRQQLIRQRSTNAENVKNKQLIEKQMQKLKADFEKVKTELQNYKKNDAEQRKVGVKARNAQQQVKAVRQQLNNQKNIKTNLEKQIQKLQTQVQNYRKNDAESKKSLIRTKKTQDQIKSLKQQVNKERTGRINLQKQIQRLNTENQNLKRNDLQSKKSLSKGKQNEQEIKNIRQQLNNEKADKKDLEKEINAMRNQIQAFKRMELQWKKTTPKLKKLEEDANSLRDLLNSEKHEKQNIQKQLTKYKNELENYKRNAPKMKQSQQQIKNLKITNNELEKMISQLNTQNENFRKAEVQLKRIAPRSKQNQQQLKSLRARALDLEGQNANLIAELQSKKRVQLESKRTVPRLKQNQQQLKNLRSVNSSLQNQVARLQTDIGALRKSQTQLNRIAPKLKQNQEEIRQLKDQLNNQRSSRANSDKQLTKMKSQLESYKKNSPKAKQNQQQIKNLKSANNELEKEVVKISNQVESLRKADIQLKRLSPKMKQSQEQIKALRARNAQLERENARMQGEVQTLKRIQYQTKRTVPRLRYSQEQVKSLRSSNANFEEQIQKLQSQVDLFKKSDIQLKKLTPKLKQYQEEVRSLRDELNLQRNNKMMIQKELQFTLKQREAENKNTPRLKNSEGQISSLKIANSELERENSKLSIENQMLRKTQVEYKRIVSKAKQNQDQLHHLKARSLELERENGQMERDLETLKRAQIESKKNMPKLRQNQEELKFLKQTNASFESELMRLQTQVQNLRRVQVQSKRMAPKIKQNDDELKILRQQFNNERVKSLNQQSQLVRLRGENQIFKRTEAELKKNLSKFKQLQEQNRNFKEQAQQLRASNTQIGRHVAILEKQNQSLRKQNEKIRKLEQDSSNLKKSQADLKKNNIKLKQNEEQIRRLKQELTNEKEKNVDNGKIKKNLQTQLEKAKVEIDRLRIIEGQNYELKLMETEYKRSEQRTRQSLEQINISRGQIDNQKAKNFELTNQKLSLERTIKKLQDQIQGIRRKQAENRTKEIQAIKRVENDSKAKEDSLMKVLNDQIKRVQSDLSYSLGCIQKIINACVHLKSQEELQKVKNEIIQNNRPVCRKILPLIEILIKQNTKYEDMQSKIERIAHEQGQRRKKIESEHKTLLVQLNQLKQNSNSICQGLKSAYRIWGRSKPEQLLGQTKIIQILNTELRKGNHNHLLEQIESEILITAQSMLDVLASQLNRIEDGHLKKLQQKERQIDKFYQKQQSMFLSESQKEQKIKQLEEQLKLMNLKSQQDQKQIYELSKQLQRLTKQEERIIYEANSSIEQLNKQFQINALINKQMLETKKQIAHFFNQKESLQNRLNQSNQQISRLKKLATDYVQQQKKVLESLDLEGRQKQRFQKEFQSLRRQAGIMQRDKQAMENKIKSLETQMYRLKQIQILHQSSSQENQFKLNSIQSIVLSRQKQLKNLQERIKGIIQDKDKAQQQIIILERQLSKEKFEAQKINKNFKQAEGQNDKLKHQLNRQVQKLNLQIKYEIQQKESQKNYYSTIISRLQKSLADAQAHRIVDIKDIQTKMEILLKQKEDARRQVEIQHNKYRDKLKDVSKDLQLTSNTGQRQKIEMKRQIQRLTVELNSTVQLNQSEKNDLLRTIDKLTAERQRLIQQKTQEKRLFHEQFEKSKNEEYNLNFEKLKRHRDEIKALQQKVDQLNQNMYLNQVGYNKKIKELETQLQTNSQEGDIKNSVLQSNISIKDKELKNLNERIRVIVEQKDKAEQHIIYLERELAKQKTEFDKLNRSFKENQDQSERLKHNLNRQIERLNLQITFQAQEKQQQKTHYLATIGRVEKNLADSESHRNQDVRQIQAKMQLLLKEKQDARRIIELQQIQYREKLREVSRDLELTNNTGQRQKIQMKRQIDRLTVQLNNTIQRNESDRNQLLRSLDKITLQKQKLIQQRMEERRTFQEQIQKAKNQEYQINYQKVKKHREQIRTLQVQVDHLNQIIDYNQGEFNRVVEDNKMMSEKIAQFGQAERSFQQEVQVLKDKSLGELNNSQLQFSRNADMLRQIQNMESKVRELEILLATGSKQLAFTNQQYKKQVTYLHEHYNKEISQMKDYYTKEINQLNEHYNKQISYLKENYKKQIANLQQQNKKQVAFLTEQHLKQTTILNEQYKRDTGMLTQQARKQSALFNEQYKKDTTLLTQQNRKQVAMLNDQNKKQITAIHEQYQKQLAILSDQYQKEVTFLKQQLNRQTGTLSGQLSRETTLLTDQVNRQNLIIEQQKDIIKDLQARFGQIQSQNIRWKVQSEQFQKQFNHLKEENFQIKTQKGSFERQLYASKSKPDSNQNQALLLSKYEQMSRKLQQVSEQSLRYKMQLSNYERMLKQRQGQTIRAVQIKQLQLEKQMIESSWKQRFDVINQRNKQITKQLQFLKESFDNRKEQYNSESLNLKVQKQRFERGLADTERRLAELRQECSRTNRQLSIRDEQKKSIQQKYYNLQKNYDQKLRHLQKIENQMRNATMQIKHLNNEFNIKQQSQNLQIKRITQFTNQRIDSLQRENDARRKVLEQKQLQIRELMTKLAHQTHEKATKDTQKQMEYQTSSLLYTRTIDDLRKEVERLQTQLDAAYRKSQQKITECSKISMDLKQSQIDKQISDEQNKYKIEVLTNKINDLLRQIESVKAEAKLNRGLLQEQKDRSKNQKQRVEKQRQRVEKQKQRLQKSINQINNRHRLAEDALHKAKVQKVSIFEKDRTLRQQVQGLEQQLRRLKLKQSRIEGGTVKIKQQNKYLKEIVHMLDTNYVEDEEEDQNQIKILMKISEEISYLIERNAQLQSQSKNNSAKTQVSSTDEQWLSCLQFLIESILDYLNQSMLIGHKNVTKFIYSAEFKAQSLYDHRQKYMVYVENFIKELFQSVVAELSENISLYERTFADMKKFVDSYFISRDQKYLQSLRKCLKKFEN